MIKQRKLEELQNQQSQQNVEEMQMKAQIEQLEVIVKTVLSKDALQRYGNLKTAHPEKAVKLLVVLGQLIQQGKIKQLNDEELKQLLFQINPAKREIKIKRV